MQQDRFSLVAGGPLSSLLERLGLTGPDQLPHARAAVFLATVAWALPALLAAVQSIIDPAYPGWEYFQDLTVYARYLVAVWVVLATEHYADGRIGSLIQQFDSAQILHGQARPRYTALLARADRLSASAVAEIGMLVAAVTWSVAIAYYTVTLSGTSWEGSVVDGTPFLSWSGYAASFVSNPFFLFLVLRWIWRFFIWTLLLYRISRLPLQLTPLHPDRAGGLGFLTIYPGVFSGFVFALSCVVASSFIKDLSLSDHSMTMVWLALAMWMALNLVLFLGPLMVFIRPLYASRERALLDYGRLASEHHLAFHQQWIEAEKSGALLLGSAEPSSISDLNASVQAVRDMRTFPVDKMAVSQLILSSGLPLLAVIIYQIPTAELIKWLLGAIL